MDADIWSNLQDYIPLQLIYEKLSQNDLSRLCLVSKEWNHASLQRVLPKNSFVTIITWARNEGEDWDDHYLNGIITCDINNVHSLTFQNERFRLRPKECYVPPFEVEGFILCHHPDNIQERGVFNVHTQTWHVIPEAPNKSDTISVCGLIVDTIVKPFTFKLIEGCLDIATQIYDSQTKSWSVTSSRLLADYENLAYDGEYTCVCRNGTIYISVHENVVLKYSLIDDLWTTLEFPAVITPIEHNTLGVWESRIFTVRESLEDQPVTVWEIVNEETQEWVEYANMPDELYQWMFEHDFPFSREDDHDEQFECNYLRTFFRDGYILFCFWTWYTATANALVLFNMATKEWMKVDLSYR
jgi:hypothetical protein